MAFTEASLTAQLAGQGAGLRITQFQVGATTTDVYVENYNECSRKSGWAQLSNALTDAQAEAAIETALSM